MPNPKPTPSAYPIAFHAIVRTGRGEIHVPSTPWKIASCNLRFRQFITLLRSLPGHELHSAAMAGRWCITADWRGETLAIERRAVARPGARKS